MCKAPSLSLSSPAHPHGLLCVVLRYCLEDVSGMDVMLCGPMGFMRAVYSILRHELQVSQLSVRLVGLSKD